MRISKLIIPAVGALLIGVVGFWSADAQDATGERPATPAESTTPAGSEADLPIQKPDYRTDVQRSSTTVDRPQPTNTNTGGNNNSGTDTGATDTGGTDTGGTDTNTGGGTNTNTGDTGTNTGGTENNGGAESGGTDGNGTDGGGDGGWDQGMSQAERMFLGGRGGN